MGVNMPAKCVVFDSVQKHDGECMRELLTGMFLKVLVSPFLPDAALNLPSHVTHTYFFLSLSLSLSSLLSLRLS